jgi:hypothetical protein
MNKFVHLCWVWFKTPNDEEDKPIEPPKHQVNDDSVINLKICEDPKPATNAAG